MANNPLPPGPAPDQPGTTPTYPPGAPGPGIPPVQPPDVPSPVPVNDPGTPTPIGIPPVVPPSVPPGPSEPEIPATM